MGSFGMKLPNLVLSFAHKSFNAIKTVIGVIRIAAAFAPMWSRALLLLFGVKKHAPAFLKAKKQN